MSFSAQSFFLLIVVKNSVVVIVCNQIKRVELSIEEYIRLIRKFTIVWLWLHLPHNTLTTYKYTHNNCNRIYHNKQFIAYILSNSCSYTTHFLHDNDNRIYHNKPLACIGNS